MKRQYFWLPTTLLVVLLMLGCSKETAGPETESGTLDIENLVADEGHEFFYDLSIDDRSEDNMFDGYQSFNGSGSISAPLDSVFRFGRIIDSVGARRAILEQVSDDTVRVGIVRHFAGKFVIFNKLKDTTGTRPIVIHRKRMHHTVRRNAIFVKRENVATSNDRSPWQLKAITFGSGQSRPASSIMINQVIVAGQFGDTLVIQYPLRQYLPLERIPRFAPGETVTVTVRLLNNTANPVDVNGDGSTETVLLHYGANRDHHARKRFEFRGVDPATGDQVYVGRWQVHQQRFRVYHAVVDVVDNGTIYDSDATTYPYNSMTWGMPYRVVDRD